MNSVLGPRGLPMVELGGDRAWRTFHKGDVIASLQWIEVQAFDPEFEEEGPVPCMCLFHAHRRMDQGSYVIPQRNAFQYALADGNGVPDAFKACVAMAAVQLGFSPTDTHAIHRVFDIVLEAMPDLIRMPSDQPAVLNVARPVQGIEATAKVNGKTIREELI